MNIVNKFFSPDSIKCITLVDKYIKNTNCPSIEFLSHDILEQMFNNDISENIDEIKKNINIECDVVDNILEYNSFMAKNIKQCIKNDLNKLYRIKLNNIQINIFCKENTVQIFKHSKPKPE